LADTINDYQVPLSFSNGLTKNGRNITLGGALGSNVAFTGAGNIAMSGTGTLTVASIGTGVVKSTAGLLGLATPGADFENPLTFSNGLTRTVNAITLGGALASNVTFTGAGNIAMTGTGTLKVASLGTGVVKSTAGLLGLATPGADFENPLTFSNGLTRTVNAITLGGALGSDATFTGSGNIAMTGTGTLKVGALGGVAKFSAGLLGLATPGTDFENPLTFSNGLTRTVNAITLGGALASNVSFTGAGNIAMSGTGTLTVASIGTGVVKSTAGLLGLATPGTDFENPLTFSNGLTRTVNAITLGGALSSNVNFTGAGNIAMSGTGTLTVASIGTGIVKSTAGLLGLATPGTDFENPLTFSNGLTRTTNAITLGGALTSNVVFTGANSISIASLNTGLVKATAGLLVPAIAGTDFENPLTFSNGLTRTVDAITLGGSLANDVNFSGTGNIAITGSGSFTVSSLGTGMLKSTSGLLAVATSGTDYQSPMSAGDGITISSSTIISLGGTLTGDATFTGSGNLVMGSGTLNVPTLGTGIAKFNSGLLGIATPGYDFETPLTFSNGLSRSGNAVSLGGALSSDASFTGAYNLVMTAGSINITSLGSGLVKANSGVLVPATPGTDFENPLSFSNGLTRTVDAITLGGSLASDVNFTGSGNINLTGSGAVVISTSGNGNALDATTSGTGWAGSFTSGASGNGLYVSAANGQTGLQINSGSVVLSHTDQPITPALTVDAGTNGVIAIDNGIGATYNITLNTGTNGQLVYIFNGDTANSAALIAGTSGLHINNTGPNSIAPGNTLILIYVTNAAGSGWVTK